MPNLDRLTTDELSTTETSCLWLIQMQDKHDIMPGDQAVKLSTLLADIHMVQEDRQADESRRKLAEAARKADRL
jgi:hypothetical protein